MATTPEYNEFVCERLEPFGAVRSRKMFGEYMVYLKQRFTRGYKRYKETSGLMEWKIGHIFHSIFT